MADSNKLETLHRLQNEWLQQKSHVPPAVNTFATAASKQAAAAKAEEKVTDFFVSSKNLNDERDDLQQQQQAQEEAEEEDENIEIQRAANIIQPTVKKWLEYHSEIEVLQKAIKERKEKKKELDMEITAFMMSHEIPHFDLKEKQLVLNVTQRQQPLSKSFISDVLSRTCNVEQLQKVTNMLFKERPTVEKTSLKYKKSKAAKIYK